MEPFNIRWKERIRMLMKERGERREKIKEKEGEGKGLGRRPVARLSFVPN
jgi:hypothetical protein